MTARFAPRSERGVWYDRLYAAFRGAYDGMRGTYEVLAAIRGGNAAR